MRSGWSVDTPPDGETAMGPSLPTECEASCSACAVDCFLAAWFYWKRTGFKKVTFWVDRCVLTLSAGLPVILPTKD